MEGALERAVLLGSRLLRASWSVRDAGRALLDSELLPLLTSVSRVVCALPASSPSPPPRFHVTQGPLNLHGLQPVASLSRAAPPRLGC